MAGPLSSSRQPWIRPRHGNGVIQKNEWERAGYFEAWATDLHNFLLKGNPAQPQ